MNQRYDESEINLVTVLYKSCLKWRGILIFAVLVAIVVGATRMAMNIQTLGDEEKKSQLYVEYQDELNAYEAEGLALKLSIQENERNLRNQKEYNENSLLMKIDSKNEWQGSMSFYVDTDYQILPGSSIQNENPAYKITYAYYDYCESGEFYGTVLEKLSFELKDQKYLREILTVEFDDSRYAFTIRTVADTKEHSDELLRIAAETLQSRYSFIQKSLGKHSLKTDTGVSYVCVNTDREQYQFQQETKEKEWMQNVPELNEEYRKWKAKKSTIQMPVVTVGEAIKDGIKWIIIAGVAGCLAAMFALSVVIAFSGKIKDREDLGNKVFVLGELPVQKGKRKQNCLDRIVYHIFGVAMKCSEYDGRVAAIAQTLGKMLENEEKSQGTIALVGDAESTELSTIAKQLTKTMPAGMQTVAAGNILTNAEANQEIYKADAVAIVVTEDATMCKVYRQMVNQLEACEVKTLGVILTNCPGIQ